jgi:F-type H+-transporting ATPase subunit delta
MSAPRVAARYAEALFGLAQQRGAVGALRRELADIAELVRGSQELRSLLARPDVSAERKAAALDAALGGRFSREIVALLEVLVNHQRGEAVPAVSEAFGALADRAEGVVVAEAATVVPLTGQQRDRLVAALARLTGQRVRLAERLDASVLAGVRLRVGDRLIDGSAAGRLARMREELMVVQG